MAQCSETPWRLRSFYLLRRLRLSFRVDGSARGGGSRASSRTIRGGGRSARLPSWSATRAVLADYQRRRGDAGGREPAGHQMLGDDQVGCRGCCYVGGRREGWWRYTDLSKYCYPRSNQ